MKVPLRSLEKILWVAIFIPVAPAIHFAQSFPPIPKVVAQARCTWEEKTYTLQVVPKKGALIEEARVHCDPGDRCAMLSGDFVLVLKSGSEELSKVTLRGLSFDYYQRRWHASGMPPLKVFPRTGPGPLIYVGQYAASNGNDYHFYWLETQKGQPVLKPVRFVHSPQKRDEPNVLYAGHFEDAVWLVKTAAASRYRLWIEGYNNADVGGFLEQYVEEAPGVWRCVGEYTHAQGTYESMKKRLSRK